MDNEAVVEKIVRSLSFEVVAVPQDTVQVDSTSKSTPLNVKIRVRKKGDAGLPEGVLSMSKVDLYEYVPGRIRLVSSDQTIMSFNVVMEGHNDYRQNLTMVQSGATYKADIATSSGIQSDGVTKNRFTLSKKDKLDTSPILSKRNKDIFGRCKPEDSQTDLQSKIRRDDRKNIFFTKHFPEGGCLDPPFGEDKYPYKPAKETPSHVKTTAFPTADDTNKIKTSSIFKNNLFKRKKKSSQDEDHYKNITDSAIKIDSVLNLCKTESLQASNTYSTSIITYPPTSNSSDLQIQEGRHSKIRYSSEEKSSTASYFIVPKKNKNQNDCIIGDYDQNTVEDTNDIPQITLLKTSIPNRGAISDKTDIAPLLIPLPLLATLDNSVREDENKPLLTHEISCQNIDREYFPIMNGSETGLVLPKNMSLNCDDEIQDSSVEENKNDKMKNEENVVNEDLPISQLLITHKLQDISSEPTYSITNNIQEVTGVQNDKTEVTETRFSPTSWEKKTANETNSQTQLILSTLYKNIVIGSKSSIDSYRDNSSKTSKLADVEMDNNNDINEKESVHDNKSPVVEEQSNFNETSFFLEPGIETVVEDIKSNEINMIEQLSHENIDMEQIKTDMSLYPLVNTYNSEKLLQNSQHSVEDLRYTRTSEKRNAPLNSDADLIDDKQSAVMKDPCDDDGQLNSLETFVRKKTNMNEEAIKIDSSMQDELEKRPEPEKPPDVYDVSEKPDITHINLMDRFEKLLIPALQEYGTDSNISNNNEDVEESKTLVEEVPDDSDLTIKDDNIHDDNFQPKYSQILTENLSDSLECKPSEGQNLNKGILDSTKYDDVTYDTTILSGASETIQPIQDSEAESAFDLAGNEDYELENNLLARPDTGMLGTTIQKEFTESLSHFQLVNQPEEIGTALKPSLEVDKNMIDSDASPISILRNDVGVWKVDLALHSYIDENNEQVIKSFDSEKVPEQYQTNALIIAKCSLESDSNEIKIPIDHENELTIRIKSNKPNQYITDLYGKAEYIDTQRKKKIILEIPGDDVENTDCEYVNKSEASKHNIMINDNIHDALISIYEQELVPLQDVIKGLREEIDMLTSYRMMLKEKYAAKRLKPPRLVNGNRKCGCSRRL